MKYYILFYFPFSLFLLFIFYNKNNKIYILYQKTHPQPSVPFLKIFLFTSCMSLPKNLLLNEMLNFALFPLFPFFCFYYLYFTIKNNKINIQYWKTHPQPLILLNKCFFITSCVSVSFAFLGDILSLFTSHARKSSTEGVMKKKKVFVGLRVRFLVNVKFRKFRSILNSRRETFSFFFSSFFQTQQQLASFIFSLLKK